MLRKNFPGRKLVRKELALSRQTEAAKLSLTERINKATPNSKEWMRLIEQQANSDTKSINGKK